MLNLLLAQRLQVHQPAGPVQVVLRSSLDGPSFGLFDHKEQQQHGDQPQPRGHLRGRRRRCETTSPTVTNGF